MNKKVYILNSSSGNSGVAKLSKRGNKKLLSINFENDFPSKKICYITSGDKIIDIGYFHKNRSEFEISGDIEIEKIIIRDNDNIIAWTGEKPEDENVSDAPVTFDTFFGGGFTWHRIRGNFIMFDYSIIHHILSSEDVYHAINRAGYYCAGIKNQDDVTIITIAIPMFKDMVSPFTKISSDTYTIYSGKLIFEAICVGIDKTGEFFISI